MAVTALEEYCKLLLSSADIADRQFSRQDLNGFLFECANSIEERKKDLLSDSLRSLRISASEYFDYELEECDTKLMRAFSMGVIKAATRLCELIAKSMDLQEYSISQMSSLSSGMQKLLSDAVTVLNEKKVLNHTALAMSLGIDKSRLSQVMGTGNITPYFITNQLGREKHYSLSALGVSLLKALQESEKHSVVSKPIKEETSLWFIWNYLQYYGSSIESIDSLEEYENINELHRREENKRVLNGKILNRMTEINCRAGESYGE